MTLAAAMPVAAILVSAMLWGLWWIPVRSLAELGLSGDAINFLVFGSLTLLLLPLAWRRAARLRAGGPLLLGAGACFAAALTLWNHAVLEGEVVRVVLLFYLAPVWATLLAWAALGLRITRRRVVAVTLGLTGAAVVLGAGGSDLVPLPRGLGDWCGLLSGILFALSATFTRLGKDLGDFERTYVALAIATAIGGLLLFSGHGVLAVDEAVIRAVPASVLAALCWMLPAIWLLFWAAARLDPGRVSILLMVEVIAAAISSQLLTDEPFGMREAVGCLLILSAGVMEFLPTGRRKSTSRAGSVASH